jgi:hypothetical protein
MCSRDGIGTMSWRSFPHSLREYTKDFRGFPHTRTWNRCRWSAQATEQRGRVRRRSKSCSTSCPRADSHRGCSRFLWFVRSSVGFTDGSHAIDTGWAVGNIARCGQRAWCLHVTRPPESETDLLLVYASRCSRLCTVACRRARARGGRSAPRRARACRVLWSPTHRLHRQHEQLVWGVAIPSADCTGSGVDLVAAVARLMLLCQTSTVRDPQMLV